MAWYVNSRYHDTMTKQTTVRLPDDVAKDAEAVARVRGTSVNALIVDALQKRNQESTRRQSL